MNQLTNDLKNNEEQVLKLQGFSPRAREWVTLVFFNKTKTEPLSFNLHCNIKFLYNATAESNEDFVIASENHRNRKHLALLFKIPQK